MKDTYYNSEDLKKFGNITEWQKELGDKFFDYYGSVFEEGALTSKKESGGCEKEENSEKG